jgi:hypothetical protein
MGDPSVAIAGTPSGTSCVRRGARTWSSERLAGELRPAWWTATDPRGTSAHPDLLTVRRSSATGLPIRSSFERIRVCSVRLSVAHVQTNGAAGKGRIEAPQ